ncbi:MULTISPECIES: SAM-dependent methyltransferase [Rhizobium]|uniref:Class I SAM-dependent methyltransferase n=1 Tax=Rhizobium tropici TaxID=398 RepID=A0A6P1C4Y1_RHITR|nr:MULTISPECIES: cyclopropane-fatty-acyl-phospholipid synthase family protein [Rhizobium]AGB73177.1 cyclopropane-fatty-acyl-phospholipid synthase [Rhizobium tropici CIAT 899]MBB4243685.1 cyclopropane-fatty-acyl-phospholipid synthase [Rhizobium tropici]MBB5595866.1 cyclopropane-fatty-acyl-phospholipid synthase [Rhizobium tropici]MBB6493858.1 cyclopropane-fatty-acyl-phospholipid synthase [Rhizobium tropici]NEV11302.1 class I SAM-dependent methyltransferase [Rhizobium tropici]
MSHFDDFSRASMRPSDSTEGFGFVDRLLMRLMRDVRYGHVKISLPSGQVVEKYGVEPGPEAIINIRRWRWLPRLILAGDIGFAESYLDEDWTTPDLTAVIRFAAKNIDALAPAIEGRAMMRLFNRAKHLFNANTKKGSRRNIEAHYDLGNEFYKQWLDSTMLYSSGIFDTSTDTLEAAQQKKLDHILQKLDLTRDDSVLEIGCGWGALSIFMAARANAKVTGITLSPSQFAWAREAAASAGVQQQLNLRLQDYRDLDGQFDRIVSIEMFEAVGETYWPDYFSTLKRCLRPGGKAVLQVISIDEKRFDAYRRGSDFIQKYIFPGGFLPSDSALEAAVVKAGFRLAAREHFGKSYARTLLEWRTRFHARWPAIAALGFDERFRRLWHYYLCYCEAGFEEGSIDVGLYTLEHA